MGDETGGEDPPDSLISPLQKRFNACLSPKSKTLFNQITQSRNVDIQTQSQLSFLEKELHEIHTTLGPEDPEISQLSSDTLSHIHQLMNKRLTFSLTDRGPFVVVMENKKIGNLHPMNIGKILHMEAKIPNIKNISRRGSNRIAVELITPKAANEFLCNKFLLDKGYTMFIPQRLLTSRGIIRDVGGEVLASDIMTYGEASLGGNRIKILDLRRLNRSVISEGNLIKIPSNSYILTFEGKSIPKFFSIFNSISEIHPFVNPVTFCDNCSRFGHHEKVCRAKSRCPRCGEPHKLAECKEINTRCRNCGKDDHLANHRGCEEFARQKKINEIMASEGLSFMEANRKVPRSSTQQVTTSYIHPNFNYQPQQFPSLPNHRASPTSTVLGSSRGSSPNSWVNTNNFDRNQSAPKRIKRESNARGYDREGHNSCLLNVQVSPKAPIYQSLPSTSQSRNSVTPNESQEVEIAFYNEVESIVSMLQNQKTISVTDFQTIKSFFFNHYVSSVPNENEDPEDLTMEHS